MTIVTNEVSSTRNGTGNTTKPGGSHPLGVLKRNKAERAIDQARNAALVTESLSLDERLKHISNLKKVILNQKDQIVTEICKATGKSSFDAISSEIYGVLDTIRFLEASAKKALQDQVVPTPLTLMGKKSYIQYTPRGVVLVICSWNYPFFQMLVPTLFSYAAGNSIVIKPSEKAPLPGLLEPLLFEAGFPQNAVQVIDGDGQMGSYLIDLKPDYISFTGGTDTGKRIMAQASENLIPLELELGGKDPMVVFEDVHINRCVAGALWGSFTNAGQSCTSVERIIVHKSIANTFIQNLVQEADKINLTNHNIGIDMGSMTCSHQLRLVHKQVQEAILGGAKILTKGRWDEKSMNYPPTVMIDVPQSADLRHNETFGPVVYIDTFATEQEAIALANNSMYGLSASIWSKDLKRASRVAKKLKTGNISINNVMITEGNAALPFGGTKASGLGKAKGVEGLRGLCQATSIIIEKSSSKIEANWYPYTQKKSALFPKFLGYFQGGFRGLLALAVFGLRLESVAQKGRPNP